MASEAYREGGAARPLALTIGEVAGIGPDIAIAAWEMRRDTPEAVPPFVLLGDPAVLSARAARLGRSVPIETHATFPAGASLDPAALHVLVVAPASAPVEPGHPDPANAESVIAPIERAVAEVRAGRAAAIVTNPIAKSVLYAAGFRHPGHTEFLGALSGTHFPGKPTDPVMMLADPQLRVVPLTIHIPLRDVPGAITGARIEAVARITARDLVRRFRIGRPRLAVAGLNPHAGEGGSIGREDVDVIAPAIARLAADGLDITGPHSADTLFHAAARARYDAAICMYHDQALIPIKTLAFDTGVNVTLGLPFVRTSPDHGTAFDIAGTGRASATSLIEALRLAARLAAGHP